MTAWLLTWLWQGVALAASPYDGRWSVVIETSHGNCYRAYRYGLNIVNGNVSYAGDAAFDIRGRVADNGAVHVRVSRGSSYADGTGRLSRSSTSTRLGSLGTAGRATLTAKTGCRCSGARAPAPLG